MVKTVLYQKAEGSYTPKTKDYSYFGGSGVSFELTKTTIDGYIAGKNTKGDNNGYMVEVAFNQMWPDLLQLSENLSFSSNLRIRNNNCGSNKMYYRGIPVKASWDVNNSSVPIDNIYLYPAYVTAVDDLRHHDDGIIFGSLIGFSKKISGKKYYVEFEVDSKDRKCSDFTTCFSLGVKF